MRKQILRLVYRCAPFRIEGDAEIKQQVNSTVEISCLIPTSQRQKELSAILYNLANQDLAKDKFEVVVVGDGRSSGVENICKEFLSKINVVYIEQEKPIRLLGRLRNISIEKSQGKILLFLDDDTVISQQSFLSQLLHIFNSYGPDTVQPRGRGLRGFIKGYTYMEEYSFATRCIAYRRETVFRLKGFLGPLKCYEDIDFAIRATLLDLKVYRAKEIHYYHRPIYFSSFRKSLCNGDSFLKLQKKYSLLFWSVCFLSGIRFMPFLILPSFKLQHRAVYSWGIFLGYIRAVLRLYL